ncbi:hypothetical protein D3C87_1967980 [compost metagenome]
MLFRGSSRDETQIALQIFLQPSRLSDRIIDFGRAARGRLDGLREAPARFDAER